MSTDLLTMEVDTIHHHQVTTIISSPQTIKLCTISRQCIRCLAKKLYCFMGKPKSEIKQFFWVKSFIFIPKKWILLVLWKGQKCKKKSWSKQSLGSLFSYSGVFLQHVYMETPTLSLWMGSSTPSTVEESTFSLRAPSTASPCKGGWRYPLEASYHQASRLQSLLPL